MPVARLTKTMTAYTALKQAKPADMVEVTREEEPTTHRSRGRGGFTCASPSGGDQAFEVEIQVETCAPGGLSVNRSRERRPRDRVHGRSRRSGGSGRGSIMPKYLIQASYTVDGLKGVLREGGTGRRQAVERMAESLGGRVEQMYYAFGESDVYVIVDLPGNVASAALGLRVSAAGGARTKTVVLLTSEEIDEAVRQEVEYRAPGT
jgi:uncharacterized protein with GYD domain